MPYTALQLNETRQRLRRELPKALTDGQKRFLISLANGEPEWSLMACRHLDQLPAIRWKLVNLAKLKKTNLEKFRQQSDELQRQLDGIRDGWVADAAREEALRASRWMGNHVSPTPPLGGTEGMGTCRKKRGSPFSPPPGPAPNERGGAPARRHHQFSLCAPQCSPEPENRLDQSNEGGRTQET